MKNPSCESFSSQVKPSTDEVTLVETQTILDRIKKFFQGQSSGSEIIQKVDMAMDALDKHSSKG